MHALTVKMVHNNYNTTLCKRSKTHSKTSSSTKTIGANFRLGRVILVAAALIVISSSLWIQLSFYSTQYLIIQFQPKANTKHEVSKAKYYTTKHCSTQNYFNRVKTTIHYYSLVLNRERAIQTMVVKRIDFARHRLLIKLNPASK